MLGAVLKPVFQVASSVRASSATASGAPERMDQVVATVTEACQDALLTGSDPALVAKLEAFEPELRGFAYEGAGTGLAALDLVFPWHDRTLDFLRGPGSAYPYAIQIGAGMGIARLHRAPEPFLKRLDPVLGWIAVDGYGFHQGFFCPNRFLHDRRTPTHLSSFGRRCFDQGLGRSIWFVAEGSPDRVAGLIGTFPLDRRRDLWAGVGLACGYTGGVQRLTVTEVRRLAARHLPEVATGVAVAANARQRAETPAPYAELACEVICGASIRETSALVDRAFDDLETDGPIPAYETWRGRLAAAFN